MFMSNSMRVVVADLIGEDGEPFIVGDDAVMSLWDGRLIPVVRGGDGDDGGDGGDADDSDDGDDDDDGEDSAVAAREAQIRRSAEKNARKKLARKHGFGTVGELDAWIAQNRNGGDDADDDGDGGPDGDADTAKGKRKNRRQPEVESNRGPDLTEVRSDVVLELASSGIDPSRIKRAATLLMSDDAYLDLGDEIDSDDIAEAINRLRKDEAGWFPGESTDGDGRKRGVPAGRRDRKGGSKPTPEEIARSYRSTMAGAGSFKPPEIII